MLGVIHLCIRVDSPIYTWYLREIYMLARAVLHEGAYEVLSTWQMSASTREEPLNMSKWLLTLVTMLRWRLFCARHWHGAPKALTTSAGRPGGLTQLPTQHRSQNVPFSELKACILLAPCRCFSSYSAWTAVVEFVCVPENTLSVQRDHFFFLLR